jgi:hypothetical protein
MQAARLLIKLCLAAAPLAVQAADVKVKLRFEGWRAWYLIALLVPPPVPPAAPALPVRVAPPQPESGLVYVGGVQYRLPPLRD